VSSALPSIKGSYFDGQTSGKKDVWLYYKENGLLGFTDTNITETPFASVQISSRIGNTPRFINFPDGAQFETNDNDAIDVMVKTFNSSLFQGLIHKLESAKTFVIATTIGLVVFGWLFVQYGLPYTSKKIAERLPDKASHYLGQGVLDILDKQWFSKTKLSDEKQQVLQSLFQELKTNIEGSNNYKLVFRTGGDIGANAFALPDGTIVMTDELINLTDDNLDIASIMLHEIGHLKQRHSLRATIQKSGLAIFIVAITGDVSTSSSVITAIPYVLIESGFSQDMETEADSFALDYMLSHQINPEHFAIMMEKLIASFSDKYIDCIEQTEEKSTVLECIELAVEHNRATTTKPSKNLLDYFSTHPSSEERIERFKSIAKH